MKGICKRLCYLLSMTIVGMTAGVTTRGKSSLGLTSQDDRYSNRMTGNFVIYFHSGRRRPEKCLVRNEKNSDGAPQVCHSGLGQVRSNGFSRNNS